MLIVAFLNCYSVCVLMLSAVKLDAVLLSVFVLDVI
jgi:hypothetical protein